MSSDTQTQLLALFQRYQDLCQSTEYKLPVQDFDPEWQSPCQIGEAMSDLIAWQAVIRKDKPDLSNIEAALEVSLHPTIIDFYCSLYSAGIPCEYDGHPIELVQVWNDQEFAMLQENMIAHFMMQKRLNKPASMFIATCSDEMQIISIVNETGQVQLETLGKRQEAILADNIADFLAKLMPRLPE